MRRGVRLVCVLVRHCLWKRVPALERVQWAHDPHAEEGPLALASDPDGAITRACLRVAAMMPAANGERALIDAHPGPAPAPVDVAVLMSAAAAGRLDGLPEPPDGYVVRGDLGRLRAALLSSVQGELGIAGDARSLGLHGQGGIGKTVLAAALARDPEVARGLPGRRVLGHGRRARRPGRRRRSICSRASAHRRRRCARRSMACSSLREALCDRRCLLVVDDVWSAAAASAFRATGPHGRVLLHHARPRACSTRSALTWNSSMCSPKPPHANCLRRLTTHERRASCRARPTRLLEATGRVALALALVGAAIGRGGRVLARGRRRARPSGRDVPRSPVRQRLQGHARRRRQLDPELANALRDPRRVPGGQRRPAGGRGALLDAPVRRLESRRRASGSTCSPRAS